MLFLFSAAVARASPLPLPAHRLPPAAARKPRTLFSLHTHVPQPTSSPSSPFHPPGLLICVSRTWPPPTGLESSIVFAGALMVATGSTSLPS
eukprot:309219-Chlamydomonas_euryale.AAC.1